MLVAGNFLVVFGIMMLSLSTTYWQVFLSQGICMGLGAGLLYIPSLALVGIWFDKKRAIALGIVMSGIAVGRWRCGDVKEKEVATNAIQAAWCTS
jgi:MFS family permease